MRLTQAGAMNSGFGKLLAFVPVVFAACHEPSATPDPVATAAGSSVGAAAPPVKPSVATPSPSAASERDSADVWLVATTGEGEVAVIELRAGKPPKLAVTRDGEDADALKAKLDEIGGADGIPLDMHLPPPNGQGRGAYGTKIVKYDDRLYRHALTNALEPTFSVKPVVRLTDPLPPENLKQLKVSRSGEEVGTLDFTHTPPKLTVLTEKSDGDALKRQWERVQELGALKVRYQQPKDSVETLVTVEAKPGDATYPQLVVLYLMVEESYRARYAYELEFVD
jgi:hypothetical protein